MTSASDTLVIAQLASDVLRLESRVASYRAMVSVALEQHGESLRRIKSCEEQMAALREELRRYTASRM